MKKIVVLLIAMSIGILVLSGCGAKPQQNQPQTSIEIVQPSVISPDEAQKRLESEEDIILLDVRTQAEYEEKHIPGSILIPVDELEKRAEAELTDKEKVIFVYCRSGNRSTTASNILAELGYTKVYNLGGINDWPYEVESGK
jgi:rhodanese-related sulfurtransferase